MGLTTATIFAALLVLANAGPVYKLAATEESSCALTCSENTKFNYQPGTVYEFSYNAKTTTKMNGASEDSAMIHMNAEVEIEPLTKCDLVMRIKDASLRDSEDDQNSQAFKEAMKKQALKFSFQDGRIDHICAMDGEPTWILNIKRGILSAFQNSMDNFDRDQNMTETDVVGTCRSEYKVVGNGRKTETVEKTKNLLSCSDREGYRLAIQSIGYNVPSFVKSLPLMKSEYKCTQTLDLGSNTLQSSSCSEEHVFRPFSYGKNGAMTSSEQTLTFTNKKRAGRPTNDKFSRRSTLLFQHEYNSPSMRENEEKIEAKLQELCQKAVEEIRPEVPEMVNQLIEHMRQVDRNVLSRVYKKINQRNICAQSADRIKQYFHDAIPMVGTSASVSMIQDLIAKKHVVDSEAEMWLLSLSFVHHPTKEMISAAMPLLDERDLSGNGLLAISSLASSYCNVRPDCGKDYEISALTRKLMELTHDCNTKDVDARKIIFALRAIGNIGHSHEAVSHLTRCFTRRDVNGEIRIAAMDAFRRIPCDAVRSDLMGVFRDESEDSELRLNAYIALMKCPSRQVLSEVRQVLEKEKSNQVGSFVWSHLTNLMETSDPHFQDIRNIVQDEQLKKEFNLDQRKFSRNYEGSFFFDSINTGAKVDSNVIFSEKSFVPRSANLNLTIDMFGHAINFLEFGGRVQGMEKILENFFRNHLPTAPKTRSPVNFDKTMDPFRASAYMRVFGNELRYWDDKSLNELQSSLQKLMRMQAISFSKTMVLLDSRMIIPTCVGLPLNLTMSSTGSVSLDAKADFNKESTGIKVEFNPSASVQVKGEMSVDAHMSKAGLKMVTVAHTSTGVKLGLSKTNFDLKFPKKKMEIFNLKTDFYIVHKNSEKKQKMIADNVKRHEICTGRMMKQVTGLTFCQSLQYPSVSHQNEAPFFPFTGPIDYDLYMMNEDAPNGYQIEAFSKKSPYSFYIDTPNSKVSRRIALETSVKDNKEFQFTFTAPWKNVKIEGTYTTMYQKEKITGKVSIDQRTVYDLSAEIGMKTQRGLWSFTPKFELTIPQRKMKYEGKIEINPMKSLMIDMSASGFINSDINLKVSGEIVPKEMGLTAQLRIGKEEYYIATRLGTLKTKTGFKYTPSLKITIPQKDVIEFTSEILYESRKKMSFDFKLNKVFPKTVAMNALVLLNAGKTKSKHILKVLFKSPRGNFRIIGDVDNKKAGITSRVIGSYNFGAKYSDRLTLSSKIRDLSVKKSVRYMGNIALASKKRGALNFNLKGQLAKADNHLETKFDLHYGNPKIKTNNLKFSCVLNRALKPFSHAYDYAMTIQHPGLEMNYKVEASHVQSAKWPFKKFENNVMVQMEPGKVVQTKISYSNAKVKGLPTYEGEVALSYPGRDMKMADKLTQVNKNTFENNFSVQWQKGQEITVQNTYTKTGKDIHNIENILQLPSKKQAKVSAMLQATSGAYKGKVQFSADENMISRQRINYMAEAGVTYNFNARQMSSDVKAEVMWAPNQKMSANINFDYMKMQSFNGKIVISTPFDAVKNFETQMKYTWANGKHNSMMLISWNNKNELKNEFSFMYPDFQLSYDASLLLNGKKSEMALAMKYSDMSVNGNVKISHDKVTIFNVILKHNSQRMNNEGELGLDFDILDNSGKMKVSFKYDNRKDEFTSNGEGKLNLSFRELRQIGASYNIKHNSDMSSIDMSFSSSLRNYRNGKMSIEMNRNLPRMLKATMDFTLNGNPMLNMNLNYGKQRDNIKVKADMTGPDGEKMTASGNVNFSGSRKTANVELKSRRVEFNADGAFDYQSPRNIGGEMKMTFNRKTVMVSGNYKNEGKKYMVSGNLGLTDGRTIKMEGNVDLDNYAASLKVMSPEFAGLTEIDMTLSYNANRNMLKSSGSLKIMPYLDTTEVEMKYTKKQMSLEMKSKFESMKQAKITFMFDGDWVQSQSLKTVLQLNKEQLANLDITYNFNSINDFSINMAALTSHRRYKEFQFELKNQGPFSNMQSSLKLKLVNVLMIDAMFQNSRKVSKASIDAQILDFDEWKTTFELKGNLNFMTANVITSIAKQEVNRIEANIKEYGRMVNIKINGPRSVKFDFNMNLDTDRITFNMASTLTFDGRNKYEIFAAYEHLSKLQIKTSIPSYEDELSITFTGNLRAFNAQSKFSHNNNVYEMMLSNKEYYRQVKAILNTPYFQDTALFKVNGDLNEMNILAQVMHNKEKFELTFSNIGYYREINAKLDTPYFQPMLKFYLTGNLKKFNLGLKVEFNRQQFEMKASNEQYFEKMNFMLNTPVLNCKFMFEGDLNDSKGEMSVLFDNKKYEVTFSNAKFFQDCFLTAEVPNHKLRMVGKLNLKKKATSGNFDIIYNNAKMSVSGSYKDLGRKKILEVTLDTPNFKDTLKALVNGKPKKFNAEVKLVHKGDTYEVTLSNKNFYEMIDLNIYVPGMEAKLDFEGELMKFKSLASVKIANEMYRFGLSNDNYIRNINVEMNTPQTGNIMVNYDLQGELNNFHLIAQFSQRKNKYELNIMSNSQKGEHKMTISAPQMNINGNFVGNMESFTFDANAVYKNQKYEVMASMKNYFREISAKMTSPQLGEQSLTMKINGKLRNFSGFIEVKNNNQVYRSEFSLDNQEFNLSLPVMMQKLQIKLKGNWKNFDFMMQAINFNGERIEMSASNKNFKEIKAHLAIPRMNDMDAYIKTSGNLRNGKASMKMSFGENVFESDFEISFDGSQASFTIQPSFQILGKSGKSKLRMDLMFDAQSYKYEFESDFEKFLIKSTASMKLSPEINILMTASVPTIDSEMKLRLVSEGLQKTDIMLNLKSPWTGMSNIFYEHTGQFGRSFTSKAYIEQDGKKLAGYFINIEFANNYSFDLKVEYDNSNKQVEAKGDLKMQGRKTTASLNLKTPYQMLKEISLSSEIKMMRDGQRKVEIIARMPNQEHALNVDITESNIKAILDLNMDKQNKGMQYKFDASYQNADQRSDISRSFAFKMFLPERIVSMDFHFEDSQYTMITSGHLTWDESKNQKAGFELMLQNGREKEGKLRIITPRRISELFGKVEVNGQQYTAMGHLMMDENNKAQKIEIKADVNNSEDRADIDLTIKFPNQKKGMNLKTSINFPKGNTLFGCVSEFSMDQDPQKTFKMSTKVMSEGNGRRQAYTMQMDANHPRTGFAVDMMARLSSTPDKYNADLEMGYLTAKNKKEKIAIHGEMHKVNREVSLKLESPSKRIVELDGSYRNGNRYMISIRKKETGKENMEAFFKLNPNSRRMNIIFNYDEADPNKLYRIDADVMKSKATFKAYRTNKQKKLSTDGRITVELKTNSLFQSHIKWNPEFPEEFNTFAFQKLSMYGTELKSFGDSLGKFLSEEINVKFNLARQSFNEDMAPIRDYFATEYKNLMVDFDRAMRYMNKMFYQDAFYLRSAVEATVAAWDNVLSEYESTLYEMKHQVEILNKKVDEFMVEAEKMMDQYHMKLRDDINLLFDYAQDEYNMLYWRAIEMKDEIVSLVKNYPRTLQELIVRMRQNPHGEQVYEFLMSIYESANEKSVQAKEHVQTLTSAIYSAHATLNRHIAKARRYPVVDVMVDAAYGVYEQMLWAYDHWEVKENILALRNSLYKFGLEKMKEAKDIITDVGMNTLVFDPKRGEIMIQIRFGAAKYAYNHFMSSIEDLERAIMKLRNLIPNTDFNFWDFYYMMKPSSDLYDYIPPFKAEASIYVGQHITTFDGRHFDYKGSCSYLLARDFVDDSFTIVANYDSDRRSKSLKSLTLTTSHSERIDIFSNGKVMVDERMAKLPVKLSESEISRQGDMIVFENRRGYKVMFNPEIQLYTVEISGWYFNKMAGLFGNYNNEPSDDMVMSNNRFTNDLEQFAQSWSVSRQCRSHRNFAPKHMVPESRECAHLFLEKDSPFRYCFRQANPDEFYKMCSLEMSSSNATPMDLCKVSSYYLKKCARKGVYLSMPAMCPKTM